MDSVKFPGIPAKAIELLVWGQLRIDCVDDREKRTICCEAESASADEKRSSQDQPDIHKIKANRIDAERPPSAAARDQPSS